MTVIKELKRRNVFKVGVAYLVGAWLIIQVVETVFPLFGFGNEPARIVVIILAVGFIFALVISWVYELTPDGLKKEKDIRGKQRITRGNGNRLNFVTIGLLVMAVGFFAYDKFVLGPGRDAAATLIAVARLAEVREMVGERQFGKAYARALQLEPSFTDVSLNEELWQAVTHKVNLTSTPSGAHVSIRAYNSEEDDWEELGQTPLEEAQVPQGFVRVRMALEGYETLVVASWDGGEYRLEPVSSLPQDMLYVKGGDFKNLMPELGYSNIELSDFLIDTYEVSNQQFMQFLDADGYSNAEYWEHPFMLDGREISFEDAMGLFKDQTGRAGPGTWEFGTYADGKASHPVGGISWHEAAAFARFKGKHLPTLYHWYWAAFVDVQPAILTEFIVPSSNFGGEDAVPAGTFDGISASGTLDMAGNVREWVWNKIREDRFLLGGGWSDPKYLFSESFALSPFNRSELNGFRLITLLDDTNLELARNPVPPRHRNFLVEEPVADEIFEVYRRFYTYDATPLNAEVIEREDAEHWTRERIELDAAYGNERLTAFLYIPKGVEPPYETVVYFPGLAAVYRRESPAVDDSYLGFFLLRSGRAILLPVVKGTFERGTSWNGWPDETNFYRELVIHWSKDIGRSLDYLETRSDITLDRLGYFGLSWGAAKGPIMIAIEPRIKAAVLVVAGLGTFVIQPEVDPFNFLPRVTPPTRMINITADFFYPLETSALPFYELLGAKPKDMVLMERPGHYVPRKRVLTETLDWFDRYPARQP